MPSASPHADDRLRHYLNALSSLKRGFLQRGNPSCLPYTAKVWCLKAIHGSDMEWFLPKRTNKKTFPCRSLVLRSILVQISYLGGFKGERNDIICLIGQSGAAQVVSLPEVSTESRWPGPLTSRTGLEATVDSEQEQKLSCHIITSALLSCFWIYWQFEQCQLQWFY